MAWKNDQRKRTYQCWQDMRQRCQNERHRQYKNYGARGISICDRWLDSFDNFLSDMGLKPEGKTLDRVDNDGNYSPENCHWATPAEQSANRRSCVFLEYDGKRMTVDHWAYHLGRHPETIRSRIRRGLPLHLVLERDSMKTGKRRSRKAMHNSAREGL